MKKILVLLVILLEFSSIGFETQMVTLSHEDVAISANYFKKELQQYL